ncbi:MAG: hypothetical protein ACQET6_12320 [Bacillota bacterium]|uniref:hypothetical protein n=1 Tax=Rossellomorea sp. FM04394 TaxID=3243076 RepID=UPI0035A5AE4D
MTKIPGRFREKSRSLDEEPDRFQKNHVVLTKNPAVLTKNPAETEDNPAVPINNPAD